MKDIYDLLCNVPMAYIAYKDIYDENASKQGHQQGDRLPCYNDIMNVATRK